MLTYLKFYIFLQATSIFIAALMLVAIWMN